MSDALPEDTFQVLQFDAEEEVSQLFHVELRLVSRDPNIDFDLMLERSACLSIITKGKQRNIHGMLAEFEQGGEWQNGLYEYRALLVPRLWMLSQSTQNQIFQDQTVLDIVSSELKNVNKKGSNPLAEAGLGSDDDYEMFTIHQYEEREYVVQYKETDLNFISRLMEHEGLYYYFEHNDDCEKLVITDTFAEEHISDNSEALFQSEASGVRYDNRVVYKLSRMQKQIPSSVLVKDFNYRSPSLPMQAMGDIDESGIGFVTEFGAHFKSPEEGEALATVRAEEFKCRQNTYSGESNISDFSCGHLYSLLQHFRSDYNQSYMLTKVKHQGSQEIESWGNIGSTKYSNQFDCIPALLQFRPQRLAVKPRLFGIMNGVIDSEQDLGRADLDEQGRYKVQMPFDISGVAPGLASRRIRMAQPYGGSGDDGGGTGMSFPLLKGTEVIWTCIDGDIDRPIITGAVPNPSKPSPTNTQNATSNVIKTTSGITMGFLDGAGGASQTATGSGDSLAAQQQNQRAELALPTTEAPQRIDKVKCPTVPASAEINFNALPMQQQNTEYATSNTGVTSNNADNSFVIDVPNTNARSYFRMGAAVSSSPELTTGGKTADTYGAGILSYTDGDYTSVVKGKISNITGDSWVETNLGFKYSYALSNSYTYSLGQHFLAKAGLHGFVKLGMSVDANVGVGVGLQLATSYSFGMGSSYDFVKDTSSKMAHTITNEVDNLFEIKVDPHNTKQENFMEGKVQNLAAAFAAASGLATVGIGALALHTKTLDTETLEGKAEAEKRTSIANTAAIAHASATYAVGAALTAAALCYQRGQKISSGIPAAVFKIEENKALLSVGGKPDSTDPHEVLFEAKENGGKVSGDSENTSLRLSRVGPTGSIMLDTGSAEKTGIFVTGGAADEGGIVLILGKTAVCITAKGIEFDTPDEIKMNIGGKNKFMVNKKGCHIYGDLFLEGSVDVGGDIKSGGNVEGKKIVGSNGDLGGAAAAPKKPEDPSGSGTKKLIDFWEKKIKENSE